MIIASDAPRHSKLAEAKHKFTGKYKVNIDGEWYTVPGRKISALDDTFCSISFGGQSISVERTALTKCENENSLETDAYEV